MARIDHTGHSHPMTPAGRAACRRGQELKAAAPKVSVDDCLDALAGVNMPTPGSTSFRGFVPAYRTGCTITGTHCENCGATDYESINLGDQGYSACCNEIVTNQHDCRNHHN
jgi:hypothetical protein